MPPTPTGANLTPSPTPKTPQPVSVPPQPTGANLTPSPTKQAPQSVPVPPTPTGANLTPSPTKPTGNPQAPNQMHGLSTAPQTTAKARKTKPRQTTTPTTPATTTTPAAQTSPTATKAKAPATQAPATQAPAAKATIAPTSHTHAATAPTPAHPVTHVANTGAGQVPEFITRTEADVPEARATQQGVAAVQTARLAQTGADDADILGLGTLLAASGAMLVVAARRRRRGAHAA
ncbi:hypothetical protein GCM10025865_30660 [Paraoerskovia sediminicola]|uniref:LPXTG-motif cell wall anchor domain-containing protein n=1 Tax=Paraoerskovia sediminicola TaxID=1138587 RepID=A0ABM8G6R7_9CELL|nr:hypothetical protein [Paraoerskovia sediminicola]BDZ43767.1 hypothetical protein GCM10025865_30660 [Paraoerskovia sediminicola]